MCGYLTRSGSVTVKLRSAEQAVSILGSLVNATPLLPLREVQLCDRKSTSSAGVSRVSSTFLGPSSADRWHRAGRRYLKNGRRMQEEDKRQESQPDNYKISIFLVISMIPFTSELLCLTTPPSPP